MYKLTALFQPGCQLLLILSFFILLTGCDNNQPIKIGFIGGTSGRVADLGISGRDAIQMAVEQYNKDGGINGHRIELITKNDKQDPETAQKAVQELYDSDVVAIIGPMTSDMAVAILPQLNKFKIPSVSPTVSTQQLSGIDDYLFRVTHTTLDNATKSATYHIQNTDIRKIAATYDVRNLTFTKEWLKLFRQYFTDHGGEIVTEITLNSKPEESFTEITHTLLASEADSILIIANSMDSAMLCQQIRKTDNQVSISLADWGATERLLELGGKAVEGAIAVQTFKRDYPGEKYQEFRTRYFKRFKREPGYPGVNSYDAADILFTALRKKKTDQSIKEALLSLGNFPVLQGNIIFDKYGDVSRTTPSITIIQNHKFIVVE